MIGASHLATAVLCLVVAGCGSAAEETPGSQLSGAQLELTVWPEGEAKGNPQRTRLSCNPASGDVPDPAAACALIAVKGAALFEPTPADTACAELYGGPQEARITGSAFGQDVDSRFSRNDGCEIVRWDAIESFVPIPEWDPSAALPLTSRPDTLPAA